MKKLLLYSLLSFILCSFMIPAYGHRKNRHKPRVRFGLGFRRPYHHYGYRTYRYYHPWDYHNYHYGRPGFHFGFRL